MVGAPWLQILYPCVPTADGRHFQTTEFTLNVDRVFFFLPLFLKQQRITATQIALVCLGIVNLLEVAQIMREDNFM